MKKRKPRDGIRIGGKLLLTILLVIFFVRLIATDERRRQEIQPLGEIVSGSDVAILMKELTACGVVPKKEELFWQEIQQAERNGENGEGIRYEDYLLLLQGLLGEEGRLKERERGLYEELTYQEKYRKEFWLLKSDWYKGYQKLLEHFQLADKIQREQIGILCGSEKIVGMQQLSSNEILTKTGEVYTIVSDKTEIPQLTEAVVYRHENRLLALVETLPNQVTIPGIWVMETGGEQIHFFWAGFEIIDFPKQIPEQWQTYREQIADLTFAEGQILDIKKKTKRVSGKLLSVTATQAELEGYGKLTFDENCVGYRLYGAIQCAEKEALLLGYDYADFVLDKGKICAFLITRISQPETIRVAIKNTGFTSLYHGEIVLEGQDGLTVIYGAYDGRRQESIPVGQRLVIDRKHKWLKEGRIEIRSKTNTGKIQISSVERSQGLPSYRGSFEIIGESKGLVLINEVPIEEYLYSAVPSEMPSSYPLEALKAQAICARTYACRYVASPGYAHLGAHVDDSVSYQVYNNMIENVDSTRAVRETEGRLLCYEDAPISAYYYSTSCGFGTDAGIWDETQAGGMPYLSARHMAQDDANGQIQEQDECRNMMQEETFRSYILGTDEQAYEREEPWFRWSYEVERLDVELLTKRLREQKVINKETIKKVYDLYGTKRRAGGVLEELVLETDVGKITVNSEYQIRYILNQGGAVIRQDHSTYESAALLPSAYLIIDVVKSEGNVVGYKVVGGGFGHGVGMSQNGAKAMAFKGRDCEEILSFYYPGCQVQMWQSG